MIVKHLWNAAGIIFVLIGCVGIAIPVLPTTPFILLAALCFTKGSKKLHTWLINSSIFGKYIDDYIKGRGIPLHAKIISIAFVWTGIGYSIYKMKDVIFGQVVLFLVAMSVSIHIAAIKEKNKAWYGEMEMHETIDVGNYMHRIYISLKVNKHCEIDRPPLVEVFWYGVSVKRMFLEYIFIIKALT